nr:alpha/beta hydrolase fold domain-containing protein [Nakamurella aerolata]
MASVVDHRVPVPGFRTADGTHAPPGAITVRCYRPLGADGPDGQLGGPGTGRLPVHVLLHGGGWSTGSIDDAVSDASARHRADTARCVVLAPEYRLAPEHPYPTAVHDVVAVLDWLPSVADALGADAGTVVLGGSSAGANLAAAAALAGPRRPELAGLLLEVPALDLTGETMLAAASRLDLPPGLDLDEVGIGQLMMRYFGSRDRWVAHREEPTASPLLAPDLSGLPPVAVQVGGLDPLQEDGLRFAERVAGTGTPVWRRVYPGALHGSPILNRSWPTGRRWHDDALRVLTELLHGSAPSRPSPVDTADALRDSGWITGDDRSGTPAAYHS